jgi:hypothetical protein
MATWDHLQRSMTSYWIIGGGRFGRRAAERLLRGFPEAQITVIDRNPRICDSFRKRVFQAACSDGIDYLEEKLKEPDDPGWIVPAIPVHVAYAFVQRRLLTEGRIIKIPVPERVISRLPNPVRGEQQRIYASNADFICPDDCPEPADVCTYTGKPRLCTLYRELAQIEDASLCSVVIRSRQLLPGVGGVRPKDLFGALETVRTANKPILLSTACRCHGVIDAFEFVRNSLSFQ